MGESIKYTININQKAAIDSGMSLDIVDLAIYDFIKDFANSSACMKIQTDIGLYFWVSHKLVIQQMPLLGIKTSRGIGKRIDRLIENNVLSKHPDCATLGKTMYKFGKGYDLLIFSGEQNDTPPNESSTPPRTTVPPPLNESSTYNSINNNNINNTKDDIVKPQVNTDNSNKTSLFRNSAYGDENGKTNFLEIFNKPDYTGVDINYYYNVVKDWSDSANKKRTARGWVATARTFMRKDHENKKLRMLVNPVEAKGKKEYIDYLNLE